MELKRISLGLMLIVTAVVSACSGAVSYTHLTLPTKA